METTQEASEVKMSSTKNFRKEVEDLVYTFMDMFDPSGKSRNIWKEQFDAHPDDKDFVNFIRSILNDEQRYFSPEIAAFDKERQPKLSNYKKIADFIGVPLEEYVVLPYMNTDTGTSKEITTPTPVPVGYLHMKRMQQIVRKKNKLTLEADKRDQRTGQVIAEDKGGRLSDADMYSLVTIGAEPVLKEFYGPRADSEEAREKMYKSMREGTRLPRLSDLPDKKSDKVALNTLNVYIMGAGLMSDVIRKDYVLPITVKDMTKNKINHDSLDDYGNNMLVNNK